MNFENIVEVDLPSGSADDISIDDVALWKKIKVTKGSLVSIDLNGDGVGETYRIIKTNGMVCEILAMDNAPASKFGSNNTYAGSDFDNYLNNTWYNTLSNTAKAAIVDKTFRQDSWYMNNSGNPDYSGYCGTTNPGDRSYVISLDSASFGAEITRHVYALSVQDVLDYILDTNITDGKLQNYNFWKMFWNSTSGVAEYPRLRSARPDSSIQIFIMRGDLGYVNYGFTDEKGVTRPALTIDLSKIDFEIVK